MSGIEQVNVRSRFLFTGHKGDYADTRESSQGRTLRGWGLAKSAYGCVHEHDSFSLDRFSPSTHLSRSLVSYMCPAVMGLLEQQGSCLHVLGLGHPYEQVESFACAWEGGSRTEQRTLRRREWDRPNTLRLKRSGKCQVLQELLPCNCLLPDNTALGCIWGNSADLCSHCWLRDICRTQESIPNSLL